MKKLAYIAGPYRADTVFGITQNIERARAVAAEYWKKGYAVICPHMNSALFDGVVSDQEFLDGTLAMLSKCDVIVMVGDWGKSKGACSEFEFAADNNIDVEYWYGD